jgi:2-oxoglutarate ferredoxin oxidoreductase subunit alpha
MILLKEEGISVDALRLKSFPFNKTVVDFINEHQTIYVIEQNRDAQMKSLMMIELQADPHKLISVLNYDGMPITADNILTQIKKTLVSSTMNKAS